MFMITTTRDSNWFELEAFGNTEDYWREVFEDSDVKAIWIGEAKKDKHQAVQAAICYDVLL